MALFIVASMMFTGQIGGVDWTGIGFNEYEFLYQYEWISSLGITWQVGLDALSFPMVWLTTFLLPVTIIATWDEKKGAVYHPLILLMGATLLGVFVSLGSVHVLHILGTNAYSDVLPYLEVGRKRQKVCITEILHLHLYSFCDYVVRSNHNVFLHAV